MECCNMFDTKYTLYTICCLILTEKCIFWDAVRLWEIWFTLWFIVNTVSWQWCYSTWVVTDVDVEKKCFLCVWKIYNMLWYLDMFSCCTKTFCIISWLFGDVILKCSRGHNPVNDNSKCNKYNYTPCYFDWTDIVFIV